MTTVAAAIRAALLTADPHAKAMATRSVAREWRGGRLDFVFDVAMPDRPARPATPDPVVSGERRGSGGAPTGLAGARSAHVVGRFSPACGHGDNPPRGRADRADAALR